VLAAELLRYGLKRMPDGLALPEKQLVALLGERRGRGCTGACAASTTRRSRRDDVAKSMSRDETFARDLHDDAELARELRVLVRRLGADLRATACARAPSRCAARRGLPDAAGVAHAGRRGRDGPRHLRGARPLLARCARAADRRAADRRVRVEPGAARAAQLALFDAGGRAGDGAGPAAGPRDRRAARQRVRAPGAIPVINPLYSPYELALGRLGGSQQATVTLLGGASPVEIPLARAGGDTVTLTNQFGEPMRARVDAAGNLLELATPAFTTVQRVGWIDLDAMVRDFAARDESGRGLGPLSPRETYRARVGDANIWVDYSRPAARGRPIWGGLVPWGDVWRMGANEAAHLATDRRIQLGELTLEPGTYTLFLLPAEDGWTLIVNRATGISGLERDAAQDIGSTPLTVGPAPEPAEQFTLAVRSADDGVRLEVRWADRIGSAPVRVVP
jgi:hypothetical protein